MKDYLLVLTSIYPFGSNYGGSFISEQLKYIKKGFKDVVVISPSSYYPEFFLKSSLFRDYLRYTSYPENYLKQNMRVYFPRYFFPSPFSDDFSMKIREYLYISSIEQIIKRERIDIDIIHSHFIFPAGYAGIKLKNTYKVPLVITAHGGDIYTQPFKNNWWFHRTKFVLEQADMIITTSARNYDIIVNKFKIKGNKVEIIFNGYDDKLFFPCESFDIRNKFLISKSTKIILSVGNLIKIKGHRYLIDSINNLRSNHEDIFCIIIGNGSERVRLENQIRKLKIERFVKIIEGIKHEEIPIWMNACDLFVLPSIDEGFPTVIPEALGCGKPVVATSVGGIPEIINDTNIGLLVQKGDSESLAKGIQTALNKKWNSDAIIEHAEKYTWNNISNKIIKIYSEFD